MRFALLLLLFSPSLLFGQTPEALAKDIETVKSQGLGSATGRLAWERLAAAGPQAVPTLLEAMDTPSVVQANWFLTALEKILERDSRPSKIDLDRLLSFVKDQRRQGRARRFAMEIVEARRPGTMVKLLPSWVDDAEFRPEALDLLVDEAKKLLAAGAKGAAAEKLKNAFAHSRDIEQARQAAAPLLDLGVKVSSARHLGFLLDWHLIGPFDGKDRKGFHLPYSPETKVDLKKTIKHEGRTLAWKPYAVVEPSPKVSAKHIALVNLAESRALGNADDAVAFAYTEVHSKEARKVEFRGAADDNLTVWVNGKKVFAFEEYRNGVRFDRHRFSVELRAGKNAILVKICQTPPPNPEPNWEFFLRIVDENGRGMSFAGE